MAARKQLFHPDDVKKKIKTSQLINRLTNHALSDEGIMDPSQVAAAKALIDKVIPNARQEVDVKGDVSLSMPTMIQLTAPSDDSKA